ncbi:MAG: FlgD immunoglobulin-like domain containing protein [bacterium]
MISRMSRCGLVWIVVLKLILVVNSFVFSDTYNYQDPNCLVNEGTSSALATYAPSYPVTVSIGVLLVEFNGGTHHTSPTYTVTDFENLLFSDDYYSIDIDDQRRSPDGELVYGSLRDWYQENSHGLVQITGDVINPDNNGVPVWLNMGNFADYDSGFETDNLIVDSIHSAVSSGWNCRYNIICVIAAGDGYHNIAWFGSPNFGTATQSRITANRLPSSTPLFDYNIFWGGYTTMERWLGDIASQPNAFTHVGPHAHESFHVIGQACDGRWFDQNLGLSPMGDWCVMHRLGIGPNRKGECPSHLDAPRKISVGWATPTEITANNMQETIGYVETQINNATFDFYRFTDPGSGEEFVIENRQYSGFNRFMPAWWEAGSTPLGGLLVFNAVGNVPTTNDIDNIIIVSADNAFTTNYNQAVNPNQWSVGDPGDPFPGTSANTAFTPFTTPNTNNRSGGVTEFAITNISNSSNTMTATFHVDFVVPAATQNLVIVNAGSNGQNPVLQWDANSEPDLDHYTIYRGYNDLETGQIIWNSVATTANTTWTDNDVTINTASQTTFRYKITAVDDASNESNYSNTVSTKGNWVPKQAAEPSEDQPPGIPNQIAVHQNYPNPFNPETEIRFELPEDAHVLLKIYNILGEEARTFVDNFVKVGFHSVTWDGRDEMGRDLPSGIYIYRLSVNSPKTEPFTDEKKLTLLL